MVEGLHAFALRYRQTIAYLVARTHELQRREEERTGTAGVSECFHWVRAVETAVEVGTRTVQLSEKDYGLCCEVGEDYRREIRENIVQQ